MSSSISLLDQTLAEDEREKLIGGGGQLAARLQIPDLAHVEKGGLR